MMNASAIFARAGIAIELKGGAAVNNAAVRKNGQKNSPSQRVRSASLMLITTLAEDRSNCHRRALDIADHLRCEP